MKSQKATLLRDTEKQKFLSPRSLPLPSLTFYILHSLADKNSINTIMGINLLRLVFIQAAYGFSATTSTTSSRSNVIFVGGLSDIVSSTQLSEDFERRFGNVVDVSIIRGSGKQQPYAFVEFESSQNAQAAWIRLHQHSIRMSSRHSQSTQTRGNGVTHPGRRSKLNCITSRMYVREQTSSYKYNLLILIVLKNFQQTMYQRMKAYN